MTHLKNYISEALKIKRGASLTKINFHPKTNEELRQIILDKYSANSETIDVSDIDVSNISDFKFVFSDLRTIKEIKGIQNWRMDNATNLLNMFKDCNELVELDITGWNTKNVTNAYGMFIMCFSLKQIKGIDKLNFSKCTSFQNMFYFCRNLKELNVSNWDVSNIISLFATFGYCSSLTTLDLSKWNITNKLRYACETFQNCSSLTDIGDISNWDMSNVESVRAMFKNCNSLEHIGEIAKWRILGCDIFTDMFNNCENLVLDLQELKVKPFPQHTRMFFGTDKSKLKRCKIK